MKAFLRYLVWLALCCSTFAAQDVKTVGGLAIANVKTVGGLAIASVKTVAGVDNTAGGGGPSLIVNEGFNASGAITGWFLSDSNANTAYAAAPAPLADAGSLHHAGSGNFAVFLDGGVLDAPEIYGKCLFRVAALPSSFSQILTLQLPDTNNIFSVTLLSSGTINVLDLSGLVDATTTDGISAATTYRLYWRYKKGSGANAIGEVGFATTDSRPTSGNKFASWSSGTNTTNAVRVFIAGPANSATDYIFDNFQIATTPFD